MTPPPLPAPPPQAGRERGITCARNDGCYDVAQPHPSIQLLPAFRHTIQKRPRLAVQKLHIGGNRAAGGGVAGDGPGLIVIILTPGMFLPASVGSNSGLSRSL